MTRDDKLRQVAAEFGFDPDEEIRIGGKYAPVLIDGNAAYIAGQIPRVGVEVRFAGAVGATISLDEGRRAAGISTLRALSLIQKSRGTLDAVLAVPRISVFVRSAPGLHDAKRSRGRRIRCPVLGAWRRRHTHSHVRRRAAVAKRCISGS